MPFLYILVIQQSNLKVNIIIHFSVLSLQFSVFSQMQLTLHIRIILPLGNQVFNQNDLIPF